MKKIKKLLTMALCLSLLVACQNNESNNKVSEETQKTSKVVEETATAKVEEDEEVSLEEWEDIHPVWHSITNFYEEDYLLTEAEEVAKEENTTATEILEEHEGEAHTEISIMEFDDNKIILKDETGNEIASSEYKYVKTIGKGEDHGEFAIFEAVDPVPDTYKVFALMEPHGGEGDITHFHARYGVSVDDPNLTDDEWWPVYVDPASTEEQVINEILG